MGVEVTVEDTATWPGPADRPDLFVCALCVRRQSVYEATGFDDIAELLVDRLAGHPGLTWQLRVFDGPFRPANRLHRLRWERGTPWDKFPGVPSAGDRAGCVTHREYADGTVQSVDHADVAISAAFFAAVVTTRSIGTVRSASGSDTAADAVAHQPVTRSSLFRSSIEHAGSDEMVIRPFGAFDDREHGFHFFGTERAVRDLRSRIGETTRPAVEKEGKVRGRGA